jgi:hypothetical protein
VVPRFLLRIFTVGAADTSAQRRLDRLNSMSARCMAYVLLLSSDRDLLSIHSLSTCFYSSLSADFRIFTVTNLASRINLRIFTVSYSRHEYNNEIN